MCIRDSIKAAAFKEHGETLEGAAEAIWQFNKAIVDATYDLIPAVIPVSYTHLGSSNCGDNV